MKRSLVFALALFSVNSFAQGMKIGELNSYKVFPAFLDMIGKDYKVAGKLHIAGHSNGGLSAFHIAAKYPAYFSTVTGYPGLWQDNPEAEYPEALKPMCLYMHVGDMDDERQILQRIERCDEAEAERSRHGADQAKDANPQFGHRLPAETIGQALEQRRFHGSQLCPDRLRGASPEPVAKRAMR